MIYENILQLAELKNTLRWEQWNGEKTNNNAKSRDTFLKKFNLF